MGEKIMTTLLKPTRFSGIGLHSGEIVNVTLKPSNNGITINNIPVNPETVRGSNLCTKVQNISTIEHLMCALFVLGIDNVKIDLDNEELPILDGSANPFFEMLFGNLAYTEPQKDPIIITESFKVQDEDKVISVEPCNTFKVSVTTNFYDIQTAEYPEPSLKFLKARTFCFLKDIEEMQKNHLALGGSLNNAIVIDGSRILNPDGLRLSNELAKHKLIDFLGDLYAIQRPIKGHFKCYKPGHKLNNKMMLEVFKRYLKV